MPDGLVTVIVPIPVLGRAGDVNVTRDESSTTIVAAGTAIPDIVILARPVSKPLPVITTD